MPRTLVFDVETKKEFAEVGGAHNRHLLGVAVIGYWDSATDTYACVEEHEVLRFGQLLKQADCVITFNGEHFDLPVIQPYLPFDTSKVPSLDLMRHLERALGHRIGLDACAEATFGLKKSGDGLQAIRWFRQGEIEKVKSYCLDDVRLTKQLWEYGCEHGEVFFMGRDGTKRAVPVTWGEGAKGETGIRAQLERAHRDGLRVEIEYVSTVDTTGAGHRNRRKIDIRSIRDGVVDAYCYLRNDVRRFHIDRITDIVVLTEAMADEHRVGQYALF
ncbi:MAG: ribonuclease H-like domain-containing protein [bacterium]|nr:ribonuclease H-like domain-containing protein [bacterium]